MNNNLLNSNYSIIGKKILLAFSGLILLAFIIGHVLGNMSIFLGQDALNTYAYILTKNKLLLYSARIFLLFALVIHVYTSIFITLINNKAKQSNYIVKNSIRMSFASKTMIYTGIIILVFLIFHLLHFTFGYIDPNYFGLLDHKNRHDVYTMVVEAFSKKYISMIYVISLCCLGLHLSHAFFSVCQTFSITMTRESIYKSQKISKILSIIIISGYLMIPLSILIKS